MKRLMINDKKLYLIIQNVIKDYSESNSQMKEKKESTYQKKLKESENIYEKVYKKSKEIFSENYEIVEKQYSSLMELEEKMQEIYDDYKIYLLNNGKSIDPIQNDEILPVLRTVDNLICDLEMASSIQDLEVIASKEKEIRNKYIINKDSNIQILMKENLANNYCTILTDCVENKILTEDELNEYLSKIDLCAIKLSNQDNQNGSEKFVYKNGNIKINNGNNSFYIISEKSVDLEIMIFELEKIVKFVDRLYL